MARKDTPPELRIISHTSQRDWALARGIHLRRQEALQRGVQFEYSPEELSEFTLAMIAAGLGPERNKDVQNHSAVDDLRDQDYLERYGDVSLRTRRYLGEKATLLRPGDQVLAVASPDFVSHVANHLRQGLVASPSELPPATEISLQRIDDRWHGTINRLHRTKSS